MKAARKTSDDKQHARAGMMISPGVFKIEPKHTLGSNYLFSFLFL